MTKFEIFFEFFPRRFTFLHEENFVGVEEYEAFFLIDYFDSKTQSEKSRSVRIPNIFRSSILKKNPGSKADFKLCDFLSWTSDRYVLYNDVHNVNYMNYDKESGRLRIPGKVKFNIDTNFGREKEVIEFDISPSFDICLASWFQMEVISHLETLSTEILDAFGQFEIGISYNYTRRKINSLRASQTLIKYILDHPEKFKNMKDQNYSLPEFWMYLVSDDKVSEPYIIDDEFREMILSELLKANQLQLTTIAFTPINLFEKYLHILYEKRISLSELSPQEIEEIGNLEIMLYEKITEKLPKEILNELEEFNDIENELEYVRNLKIENEECVKIINKLRLIHDLFKNYD